MDLVVIDAHLHLWDTGRLHYEWLQRPENSAINQTFGFEDFRSRAAATGVDRAVLVQADDTAADVRAVVEFALELFGPDRLMVGSDWPVAELGGGYVKMWTELSKIFDQLSAPERDAVLGGTARRFYALGASAEQGAVSGTGHNRHPARTHQH